MNIFDIIFSKIYNKSYKERHPEIIFTQRLEIRWLAPHHLGGSLHCYSYMLLVLWVGV